MTIANRITLFRLLLIPVFCALIYLYDTDRQGLRYAALGLYALVAISDFTDGYIARNYNQRTRLGARLDPLADKLVINLGFVFLAANTGFQPGLPLWFPVFILARDVTIVLGAYAIALCFGKVRVEPTMLGKVTTGFQMSTIIGILLGVSFVPWLMWATIVLSLLSVIEYVKVGCNQVASRGRT